MIPDFRFLEVLKYILTMGIISFIVLEWEDT